MIDLGTLPGDDNSAAYAINNAGQITGSSQGAPGVQTSGFLWQVGSGMINIGSGSGNSVLPEAINQSGQIAGLASWGGFLYGPATGIAPVSIPSFPTAAVFALNDCGQMVVSDATGHGVYFYSPGQPVIPITAPQGQYTIGTSALNEGGTVAGTMFSTVTSMPHAFVWMQANGVTDLTPGVDDSSWAFGINDLNQVVGGASLDGGSTFPFLYQDGTLYDLANLLDCSDSGWTNLTPESINDLGQIAGYGTFDGQTEAFLLTPTGDGSFSASGVPEPASLTLLAFGSMLFPWRRKRGRHFGRS